MHVPADRLPPGLAEVTLEGWQRAPQLRWAFQHVADLFPTHTVAPAAEPAPLPGASEDLSGVPLELPWTGEAATVGTVLDATDTDGWLVLQGGRVRHEVYAHGLTPATPHLVMSVSKSVVATVVGALVDRGLLDPGDRVADRVPELAGSGYADARVTDLLDMRSGVRFSETYADPSSEVRLLEQALGWAPRERDDVPDSVYALLATFEQERPHGERYSYRSGETDVLGWVCEAATGRTMADLASELVWRPMGAEHAATLGVDAHGHALHDGGFSVTLRDLARFGAPWARGGVGLTGERVVSEDWVRRTTSGAPDSAEVFAADEDGQWMVGGMYRHQFWFPSSRRDVLVALGIHGQLVYVDQSRDVVVAKLSSWPTPQDVTRLYSTLAACRAVAELYA